ncbi:sensor for ctr capsule biosynthesis, probable histidine kinase acting on RcsB [Pedobacter sp. BAL39]|uniref:sensor histidine kinase n=1 Tax=Pedobacter sp. BAL39 TaxID=391596 RepID=UPI0001559986|nr:HAMP domain-containing sensor histidine kinase [Pedobacter sp. BAL39]EDM38627.1 sensor for ctr capsule biosynthesis, probable histidine kinase acting on RcsB [Pedobacter sp. BAL39]
MPKLNFSSINFNSLRKGTKFWPELIGSTAVFPLESRIFHSIAIGLIFLGCVYVPYNLYAGLYVGSLSAAVLSLIFSYQYYNSRFLGKTHSSTIFALAGVLIFGVNYFTNSGIHGATDLIWPAYLLLVLSISPYHQHLRWLLMYVGVFLILHLVEYYHPELIQYPFSVGRGQFIDRVTAFPIPALAVFIIIRYIRRSYDVERKATEEKTLAVQVSKEQVQVQKDLLEQSNIEKNKLMSIISHDLRTPLMNIKGYLELLNEDVLDSADRPFLEKELLKSTNNAVEMLSNLLHWSKSQMEGPAVHLVDVNLLSVLRSTLEMEKTHALKKDISLSYTIPDDLKLLADVDMLQLVVRNLISNAVKFTPQCGQIHVDAKLLAEECKITVSDNGNGIPLDKWDKIFSIKAEPAFGTNNEKGVGLGLVLCKEYIERQGGRISFESKPGLGSRFYIHLPLKSELILKSELS